MKYLVKQGKSEGSEIREDVVLPARVRKLVNKELSLLSKKLYRGVPLEKIFKVLQSYGIDVVDESGELWSGFLTGEEGSADFYLLYNGEWVSNAYLVLMWYKRDDGRFEVTVYIS